MSFCPSASWDAYYRDQEEAEEAAEFIGPIQMFQCATHKTWSYDGCDSCYVDDLKETDRLLAEYKGNLK